MIQTRVVNKVQLNRDHAASSERQNNRGESADVPAAREYTLNRLVPAVRLEPPALL